jgi:hypothetical protein
VKQRSQKIEAKIQHAERKQWMQGWKKRLRRKKSAGNGSNNKRAAAEGKERCDRKRM